MCGRYTLTATAAEIAEFFELDSGSGILSRFNIAPSQEVPAILSNNRKKVQFLHWGLLPSWAKDPHSLRRSINARSETVDTKASFRSAFRNRRCLILADGFYEWKPLDSKRKQPFFIHLPNRELFAFAGIWDRWVSEEGEVLDSCAILTCAASPNIEEIHHRMPVIVAREKYEKWLDPKLHLRSCFPEILPLAEGQLFPAWEYYPVSTLVNSAQNDRVECVKAGNIEREGEERRKGEARQLDLFG